MSCVCVCVDLFSGGGLGKREEAALSGSAHTAGQTGSAGSPVSPYTGQSVTISGIIILRGQSYTPGYKCFLTKYDVKETKFVSARMSWNLCASENMAK